MWFVSDTFEAVCSVEEDEVNEDGEIVPESVARSWRLTLGMPPG